MNEPLVQWTLLNNVDYLSEALNFEIASKRGQEITTDYGRIDFIVEDYQKNQLIVELETILNSKNKFIYRTTRGDIKIIRENVPELRRELYIKIAERISAEVEDIPEEDCIGHMYKRDIGRTYNSYQPGIQTIYGQLQRALGVKVEPAPDEWDRLYNVDFFIEINGKYIGLQIKPTTFKHTFEDYKWKEMQETSHRKFQEKFGGKVFIVFSVRKGKKKVIHNPDVIEEIKKEIERLKME
jgi:hypothetical protein